MPAPNDPTVVLNMADNRLDDPGYVRRWYLADDQIWGGCQGAEAFTRIKQAGAVVLRLEVAYDYAATGADSPESLLVNWTCGGTGTSYAQSLHTFGADIREVAEPEPANACTVVSRFPYTANRPFMYYFSPQWHYDTTLQYADVQWCPEYKLRVVMHYQGYQVFRNVADGDDEDWQLVRQTQGETASAAPYILVYPSAKQKLCIWDSSNGTQMQHIPLTGNVETDTLDHIIRGVCGARDSIDINTNRGDFWTHFSWLDFQTTGTLILPKQTLPWDYAGEFELECGYRYPQPEDPATVTLTIVDAEGTEITSPPAEAFREFWPQIEVADGDGTKSPELYWAEMRIDPTTQVNTPAAPSPVTVGSGGRLRSLTVMDDMDGSRRADINLHDIDELATAYGLADTLDMLCQVSVSGTSVWRGYVHHVERPEAQSGDVVLQLHGSDTLSRLEVPLSDSYIGDGKTDIEYVEELFKTAGLAAADYTISATDPATLPEPVDQDEPLFQARDGRPVREMIDYLCKCWTGKDLYALRDGKLYYGPAVTDGSAVWQFYGYELPSVPEVDGEGWQPYWDEGIAFVKYFSSNPTRDEDVFANNIIVVGEGVDGTPLVAQAYDSDSVSVPGSDNYLGYEKLLLVVDTNLKTMAQVETALGYVSQFHGQPCHEVDITCEFQAGMDIRDLATVDGYTDGDGVPYLYQVRGCQRDWANGGRMHVRLRRINVVTVEDE